MRDQKPKIAGEVLEKFVSVIKIVAMPRGLRRFCVDGGVAVDGAAGIKV